MLSADVDHAAEQTRLPAAVLEQLCAQAVQQHVPPFLDGADLLRNFLASVVIFSTACRPLDSLLGGGIFTGDITEVTGVSGAGATQLAHHVVASACALASWTVVYIDCAASFSASRVQQIMRHNPHLPEVPPAGLDLGGETQAFSNRQSPTALAQVRCIPVADPLELWGAIDAVAAQLADGPSRPGAPRLVVVDSISLVVSPLLAAGPSRSTSNALIAELARRLRALALLDVAVVVRL